MARRRSADPYERARWFTTLKSVENRRQERWVLEGLRYLHHPLRAKESLQFIRPSLDLLEEVHATSNLGFPTGWVAYTLDGHNSRDAADMVASFLASRGPLYPTHLRNATLIASDLLFRSARITDPAANGIVSRSAARKAARRKRRWPRL